MVLRQPVIVGGKSNSSEATPDPSEALMSGGIL